MVFSRVLETGFDFESAGLKKHNAKAALKDPFGQILPNASPQNAWVTTSALCSGPKIEIHRTPPLFPREISKPICAARGGNGAFKRENPPIGCRPNTTAVQTSRTQTCVQQQPGGEGEQVSKLHKELISNCHRGLAGCISLFRFSYQKALWYLKVQKFTR